MPKRRKLQIYHLLNSLPIGELAREGAEAAVGRGRGGDLAGAGPEEEDAARAGGLAAGQRVKGEGTDKPQEQAQVSQSGCTGGPKRSNDSTRYHETVHRNYEDELNFAFLMANKEKQERLDRCSCSL